MKRGFSLVELLLVIALFAAIGGFSFPFLTNFQRQTNLKEDTKKTTNLIIRAQMLARGGASDDAWSVIVQGQDIYLYKGQNFSARDISYDELITLSPGVNISGQQEFNFDKISGDTADSGTLILSQDGVSEQVSINAKGAVY